MKYPLPMRIMHWTMSIIIFCLLAVGIYMTGLPDDAPGKYDFYFWHKSFGLLILGLIILRIFIRTKSIVPFCGFVLSMTYLKSTGISFFGLFTIPPFLPKNADVSHFFGEMHEIFAYTLLAVIILHVLGVIKHKFFDKNDVLKRML